MCNRLFLARFIVRLLRLVVVRVSVGLTHWHCGVALVAVVVCRLGLGLLLGRLRVRGLGRLHHVAGWWRRSVLLLLLLLLLVLGLILWLALHVRVPGVVRWRHLLVVGARLRVGLCHLVHARPAGGSERGVARVRRGTGTFVHGSTRGRHTRLLAVGLWCWGATCLLSILVVLVVPTVPLFGALVLTTPHANVTSNADATALLGNHAAERGALRQSWELLGGEDGEGRRLDFTAVGDEPVAIVDYVGVLRVKVLDLAQVFEQGKAETVLALVADGQVGEDEVASRGWAVEIGHASDRRACEDRGTGDG